MCYGMNCPYEERYTGDCKLPRGHKCPMDDDGDVEEITEKNQEYEEWLMEQADRKNDERREEE